LPTINSSKMKKKPDWKSGGKKCLLNKGKKHRNQKLAHRGPEWERDGKGAEGRAKCHRRKQDVKVGKRGKKGKATRNSKRGRQQVNRGTKKNFQGNTGESILRLVRPQGKSRK